MTTTSPPQPGEHLLPARPGWPDATGHFGVFGGRFVPEALIAALDELTEAYEAMRVDPAFLAEFDRLQRDYTGRPSPITEVSRFAEHAGGARILLKREDLNHTGSHKINNVLGQALLTKRIGKSRVIAETGAGQHGVATATAAALMGLSCTVYMGEEDTRRQALNVARMRLLGAEVIPVTTGSRTLKDAINEAFRDWVTNVETTNYVFGTVAGPHPFPAMVRDFQRVIGDEAREQVLEREGRLPDAVLACVGGGSNAIGIFTAFVPDEGVRLIGLEAGGDGVDTGRHAATITGGTPGVLHGARSYLLQDDNGQTIESHSISAGLDYPGVGPEHSYLHDIGRAEYRAVTDAEAMEAFALLCRTEGIIPAIESAHALAGALVLGKRTRVARGWWAGGRTSPAAGQPLGPRRQGRRDRVALVRSRRPRATPNPAQAWTRSRGPPRARSPTTRPSPGPRLERAREQARGAHRHGEGRGAGRAGRLPAGRLSRRRRLDRGMVAAVEGGADVVEIGVPYSDPGHGRAGDPAGGRRRRPGRSRHARRAPGRRGRRRGRCGSGGHELLEPDRALRRRALRRRPRRRRGSGRHHARPHPRRGRRAGSTPPTGPASTGCSWSRRRPAMPGCGRRRRPAVASSTPPRRWV